MAADEQVTHWVRFEDVDDRIVADPTEVARLPEIGQIIPISGTYCEVMERWIDRSHVAEGGPEIIVFTVKPLG